MSGAKPPDAGLLEPEHGLRGAPRVAAPLAHDVDHAGLRVLCAEGRLLLLLAGVGVLPAVRGLLGALRVAAEVLVFHVHHSRLGVLRTELGPAAGHAKRRDLHAAHVPALHGAHVHRPLLGVLGAELGGLGARRAVRRRLVAVRVSAGLAADVYHARLGVLAAVYPLAGAELSVAGLLGAVHGAARRRGHVSAVCLCLSVCLSISISLACNLEAEQIHHTCFLWTLLTCCSLSLLGHER